MPEDIAPGLIEAVTEEFHRLYDKSTAAQNLLKKVQQGTATYAEAQEYSLEVSRLIGQAYEKHISSAVLPDGKMYYNIASRLIPATLDENYELVSDYSVKVQQSLNENAGISLKAQVAEQNQDRVDGLVDMVSNADQYDDVSDKLLSAMENYSQNIVDETIKANADFHAGAGLSPKIIRKATRKCCDWCQTLAGEYDYPVDREVYQRHENCRCTVLYDPADGSKKLKNVYTNTWTTNKDSAKINTQKEEKYQRAGVTRVKNSELQNGLPIKGKHNSVVDKVDDFGFVLQRREYGADGMAFVDFDTSDHNISILHPTGAHKHIFDYSKKNPHGPPLPLTEEELEVNADIIQRGVNYFDPK